MQESGRGAGGSPDTGRCSLEKQPYAEKPCHMKGGAAPQGLSASRRKGQEGEDENAGKGKQCSKEQHCRERKHCKKGKTHPGSPGGDSGAFQGGMAGVPAAGDWGQRRSGPYGDLTIQDSKGFILLLHPFFSVLCLPWLIVTELPYIMTLV